MPKGLESPANNVQYIPTWWAFRKNSLVCWKKTKKILVPPILQSFAWVKSCRLMDSVPRLSAEPNTRVRLIGCPPAPPVARYTVLPWGHPGGVSGSLGGRPETMLLGSTNVSCRCSLQFLLILTSDNDQQLNGYSAPLSWWYEPTLNVMVTKQQRNTMFLQTKLLYKKNGHASYPKRISPSSGCSPLVLGAIAPGSWKNIRTGSKF